MSKQFQIQNHILPAETETSLYLVAALSKGNPLSSTENTETLHCPVGTF